MAERHALNVDEIVAVLAGGGAQPLGPGQPVTQLEHALQTAAILRRGRPDDLELAVAGLVHDIGQLLPAGSDETHAADGAAAAVLGERVARIVALHVEAKRYLVGTEANYKEGLAGDAVRLRRADDRGKLDGCCVAGLDEWVLHLRHISETGGGARRLRRKVRGV